MRRMLTPKKKPTKAEEGWVPKTVCMCLEIRKYPPTGIRTPVRPAFSIVALPTAVPGPLPFQYLHVQMCPSYLDLPSSFSKCVQSGASIWVVKVVSWLSKVLSTAEQVASPVAVKRPLRQHYASGPAIGITTAQPIYFVGECDVTSYVFKATWGSSNNSGNLLHFSI